MVRSSRLWVWCLALGACLGAGEARAQGSRAFSLRGSPKVLAAFRQVVARPSLSTVRVKCDGKDAALGTVVRADGWILTKATHRLEDAGWLQNSALFIWKQTSQWRGRRSTVLESAQDSLI